jgi:hypothetical protein
MRQLSGTGLHLATGACRVVAFVAPSSVHHASGPGKFTRDDTWNHQIDAFAIPGSIRGGPTSEFASKRVQNLVTKLKF